MTPPIPVKNTFFPPLNYAGAVQRHGPNANATPSATKPSRKTVEIYILSVMPYAREQKERPSEGHKFHHDAGSPRSHHRADARTLLATASFAGGRGRQDPRDCRL